MRVEPLTLPFTVEPGGHEGRTGAVGAVVNAVSVLSFADFVCRCVVSSIVAKLLDEIDETGNRIDPHLRGPVVASEVRART